MISKSPVNDSFMNFSDYQTGDSGKKDAAIFNSIYSTGKSDQNPLQKPLT